MKRYQALHRYVPILAVIVAGILLWAAPIAMAQTAGGNIVGKVVDSSASGIPGVTVTLSGIGAPQVFVTGANGSYRFLNQSPGRYDVSVELSGFATSHRPVDVNIGANSEIDFTMSPSVSEALTVSALTPL